ncbi:hypothetical protein [Stenotrophomonas sp. MYb238]|uniref:hypothetical protein n=1 Tax=Stenotrophomonas sp. MYb238 TaxID=2040281 RepID=UPI001290BB92|nr:hypothetical protein [Stenotrophomonas sp. MYb238]
MIEALGRLDGEGLFGRYREGLLNAVLFITAPDADDTETMEDRSARLLNRPEVCRIY